MVCADAPPAPFDDTTLAEVSEGGRIDVGGAGRRAAAQPEGKA